MKNLLLFSLFLLIISFGTKAQQIISNEGDYFENSDVSISWTLGEPVTETISDGTNILTQGFQQTKLSASEIFSINSDNINIKLFPNPTENFIYLKTSEFKNMNYRISDINGKILKEGNIISEMTEISVSKFPAAFYFFKIMKNKETIKIYQIVKQ